jgi:hypothetical protein
MLILPVSCGWQQDIDETIRTETTNPIFLVTPTFTEQSIPSVQPLATDSVFFSNNGPQRTKYKLNVYYDHDLGILNVNEGVTYFNTTSLDMETIAFILPFKPSHEFKLSEIMIENESQIVGEIIRNAIWVRLNQPLRIGESVSLSFSYEITIPDMDGVLGKTNRQINLADFYPMIPPFDGIDGWVIHEPGSVGEYLVYDVADFEVEFSTNAPAEFQVFSNAPVAAKSDAYIVIAEKYRNVVLSMCVECSKIEINCSPFKVIGSFDFQDENTGKETLNIIARALVFFSDKFGVDYPHTEMTIIEADFPDGMEYDGLFFLSKDYFDQYDQSFMNYLSLLTVHETAHQWWFGLIASDQATEPWLDEALATYSEYMFLEEFYPELTSWWWEFRVNSFNPTGSVDSGIYEFDSARPYINAVYLRGAVFLHELRALLTDDVFFHRLRQYTEVNQSLISDAETLKNTLLPEMNSDEADLLEKFFDQ